MGNRSRPSGVTPHPCDHVCVCVLCRKCSVVLLLPVQSSSHVYREIDIIMAAHVTPSPPSWTVELTSPTIEIVSRGYDHVDSGDFAALIGGVVSVVLLLLILGIAVLLWCLSRNKGSYVTNEMDGDDDAMDEDDEGSDAALQSKEPLRSKEEE